MSPIFVFGSNLAGIHGAGAARHAHEYCGALYGVGVGLQGRSYAIPTKNERIETMPLDAIRPHVADFLKFAREHPELSFLVTAIGCGLAGHKPADIAPMFAGATENVFLSAKLVSQAVSSKADIPIAEKRPVHGGYPDAKAKKPRKDIFIVWSPDGETPPKVAHDTHKAAHFAANIMAKTHPGQSFYVMARSGRKIVHQVGEA